MCKHIFPDDGIRVLRNLCATLGHEDMTILMAPHLRPHPEAEAISSRKINQPVIPMFLRIRPSCLSGVDAGHS